MDKVHAVLQTDSLNGTEALSHEVNTHQEQDEVFNDITYGKGASIIRMIQHTMGEQRFYQALRKYLKK